MQVQEGYLHPGLPLKLLLAATATMAASGCSPQDAGAVVDEVAIRELGELPGLRLTSNPELRDALARVEEDGGTPAQLASARQTAQQNVGPKLLALFEKHDVEVILEKVDAVYPQGRFQFRPITFEQALRLAHRYDHELRETRLLLRSGTCRFPIDFRDGYMIDRTFVDVAKVIGALEAFLVAELLHEDKPTEALTHLQSALTLTQHLAAHRHLESRLAAVGMRSRLLLVLQEIVRHRQFAYSDLITASQLIRRHIASWPADSEAWIGDRAQVLHSYELLRKGYFDLVLTDQELELLRAEGVLSYFADAVVRDLDRDELYYLITIRKILDSCEKPYYQRKQVFQDMRTDLQARRNEPDFPLAAARLFLSDVENAHQSQASDRALVECWAVALALAGGLERPPYRKSPYSGEPYLVTTEATRVLVYTTAGPEQEIVVPIIEPEEDIPPAAEPPEPQ